MPYVDWSGHEQEDLELDAMRGGTRTVNTRETLDERYQRLAPRMAEALREAMRSVDWFRRIALESDDNPREFDSRGWDEMRKQQRLARAILKELDA
jgi:hypothetical protein